jgi:hypothetical protein
MMVDVPKKISELPPAQLPNEGDLYPVVQLADTRKQTLAQLRTAIGIGANVTALNGLTGAADKLAYFTGVGAMALTDLKPIARLFLSDATLGAQQSRLGLVPQTSTTDATVGRVMLVGGFGIGSRIDVSGTDLNSLFTDGRYVHNAVPGATNSPIASSAGYVDVSSSAILVSGSLRYEQMWRQLGTNATYRRIWNGAAWLAWEQIVYGGANSTITSITGLTTPLSIAQGGTGLAAQTMTALPLNNSWVVYTSRRAVYRKVADNVQLEVAIRNGTATDGTVVATLPAGFRPPILVVIPVTTFPAVAPSTSITIPSVVINPDGTITCINCTNALISFSVMFSLV